MRSREESERAFYRFVGFVGYALVGVLGLLLVYAFADGQRVKRQQRKIETLVTSAGMAYQRVPCGEARGLDSLELARVDARVGCVAEEAVVTYYCCGLDASYIRFEDMKWYMY